MWKQAIVPKIWKDWLQQQKPKFEKSLSFLGTIQKREGMLEPTCSVTLINKRHYLSQLVHPLVSVNINACLNLLCYLYMWATLFEKLIQSFVSVNLVPQHLVRLIICTTSNCSVIRINKSHSLSIMPSHPYRNKLVFFFPRYWCQ